MSRCGENNRTEAIQSDGRDLSRLNEGRAQDISPMAEITQGVHVNFKMFWIPPALKSRSASSRSARPSRNEITPGGLTFRSREFRADGIAVLYETGQKVDEVDGILERRTDEVVSVPSE